MLVWNKDKLSFVIDWIFYLGKSPEEKKKVIVIAEFQVKNLTLKRSSGNHTRWDEQAEAALKT